MVVIHVGADSNGGASTEKEKNTYLQIGPQNSLRSVGARNDEMLTPVLSVLGKKGMVQHLRQDN